VGRASVAEGIATVAVGFTCGVDDAASVDVGLEIPAVFVGTEVNIGSMFTSNLPQPARRSVKRTRSLFPFIGPPF
jgi:hypothetical protein